MPKRRRRWQQNGTSGQLGRPGKAYFLKSLNCRPRGPALHGRQELAGRRAGHPFNFLGIPALLRDRSHSRGTTRSAFRWHNGTSFRAETCLRLPYDNEQPGQS